jgi:hypothetical protein
MTICFDIDNMIEIFSIRLVENQQKCEEGDKRFAHLRLWLTSQKKLWVIKNKRRKIMRKIDTDTENTQRKRYKWKSFFAIIMMSSAIYKPRTARVGAAVAA